MATIDLSHTEQRVVTLDIRDTEDHPTLIRLIHSEGMRFYVESTLDQGVDFTYQIRNEEDDTEGFPFGNLALAAGDVVTQKENEEFGNHPYIYISAACVIAPTGGSVSFTIYGIERD